MKLLIFDSADDLPFLGAASWDMVIDCARAPASTYEYWRRRTGANCRSIFDFAHGFEDLRASRELLHQGLNVVVDDDGIDWWDALFLSIESDLRQLMLARRLSQQLPAGCELYASRGNPLASALSHANGIRLHILQSRFHSAWHRVSRYKHALLSLEHHQLAQAVKDKFDPQHSVRRYFGHRHEPLGEAVVLLPSAYVNVSRTAVAIAARVPERKLLLVCARDTARLPVVPRNVTQISLDAYFQGVNHAERSHLQSSLAGLIRRLANSVPEFSMACSLGLLDRLHSLLPWGLAIRDSWKNLFDTQPISAVVCADDSNPYSRLPLILAKQRGLPTIACHHGAFDFRMAIKQVHSDFYLTKTEMEQDYLLEKCGLHEKNLIFAGSVSNSPNEERRIHAKHDKLVFFSEPFAAIGWREKEVFRDLIPRLWSLAQSTQLKLAIKLHPFESARSTRRMLREFLPGVRGIDVISGTMSGDLWESLQFAVTVQSSIALECASRAIPVFLCGWLADPYSEYASQFVKFGVGQRLDSPDALANIPQLLHDQRGVRVDAPRLDGALLERLLSRQSVFQESLST